MLSNKHKIQKRYANGCTGKQITFNELKEQVKEASTTESNTASTTIKPPVITNYDSDSSELGDDMAQFTSFQNNKNEEFGFKEFITGFTTRNNSCPRNIRENCTHCRQTLHNLSEK